MYREWDVTLQSLVFVRTRRAGLAARFCFKINRINKSPFCKLTQIVTYFEIHIILNSGFYLAETDKRSGNSVGLTPMLSAWPLRGHTALKSILWEAVFLDHLHDFSILSLNSCLKLFLKSKFMKENSLTPKKFRFQNPIFINQNKLK